MNYWIGLKACERDANTIITSVSLYVGAAGFVLASAATTATRCVSKESLERFPRRIQAGAFSIFARRTRPAGTEITSEMDSIKRYLAKNWT